ncbi:MAG: DUF58 domain-containing protein [Fimbriimonadales bacterium]
MVPTKRFWVLAALGIPVGVLAGMSGSLWPLVGYDVLLLLALVVSYRLAPDVRHLQISRSFDPVLSVRTANRIVVKVVNDGVEEIRGTLRDEPPPGFGASRREFALDVRPGRQAQVEYLLTPTERGGDFFRGSFLRQECPLGLAERIVRLPTEQPVRVYPNVLALKEFDLLKQRGRLNQMGIRKSRVRGLGSEFESLRDYGEGDDFRKIDWKATARRGKLVVRQYEQERNQAVVICLDIGRRMLSEIDGVTKLDLALDAILMLAHAATHGGDNVGLLVYADRVRRYIPPGKGRGQSAAIIEAVHDLVAEPIESDHGAAFAYLGSRWKRRSLLVAFADADDRESAEGLTAAIGPVARRHLTLLARVADPRLNEAVGSPLTDSEALYLRSAGLLLKDDRRDAAMVFEAANLHTLEAEPQDLTGALVSYYFLVKERSLL